MHSKHYIVPNYCGEAGAEPGRELWEVSWYTGNVQLSGDHGADAEHIGVLTYLISFVEGHSTMWL